jgi:hypothetical protein
MIGRRVESVEAIEWPGDYAGPFEEDEGSRGVWFLLPTHKGESKFDRPTRDSGLHRVSEPPWTFRECPDGSVEIRASILCGAREPGGEYWHGYLDEGHIWRQV